MKAASEIAEYVRLNLSIVKRVAEIVVGKGFVVLVGVADTNNVAVRVEEPPEEPVEVHVRVDELDANRVRERVRERVDVPVDDLDIVLETVVV
jgi:hypothetical protein